jgi:hypothetical protein
LFCQGGQYLINIIDRYMSAYALGLVAFCEVVSVNWVYGRSPLSFIWLHKATIKSGEWS